MARSVSKHKTLRISQVEVTNIRKKKLGDKDNGSVLGFYFPLCYQGAFYLNFRF